MSMENLVMFSEIAMLVSIAIVVLFLILYFLGINKDNDALIFVGCCGFIATAVAYCIFALYFILLKTSDLIILTKVCMIVSQVITAIFGGLYIFGKVKYNTRQTLIGCCGLIGGFVSCCIFVLYLILLEFT